MIDFFHFSSERYNQVRWVWSGMWSVWTLTALCLLLILALWWGWHSSRRLPSTRKRIALLGLRTLGGLLLLLMLAGPAVELRHVQKMKNVLPIFIDTSASMRIRNKPEGQSRLDALKDFWKRHTSLWKQMGKEHDVRLFTFDRKVRSLEQPVSALSANGDQTNLLQITQHLQEHFQQKPLAGVIVLTDGRDTIQPAISTTGKNKFVGKTKTRALPTQQGALSQRQRLVVEQLRRLQVPIHTISPAVHKALRDIAVTKVLGDGFAFLHNTATIKVQIAAQGFEGKLPVRLYREGKLLKSTTLKITRKKREYLASFSFKPRRAGKFIYSVKVPVLQGEVLRENNQKDFLLKIIRDRIRVLQVTGRPSWDVRFLRRLLKKNASVDLISFFILRTRQNIRQHNPPEREMALIQFPYNELFTKSLPTFDLVIFQNFNYAPYMSRFYLQNIAQFVRKGGALVMVGGELSFGAGGYMDTPIESLLPFELGLGKIDVQKFSPQLSEIGTHHPITRLLPNAKDNQALWSKLSPQPGTNRVGDARKDAFVLIKHPTLKTSTGNPLPVLSIREVDKGRVMALTTDGSWKWNFAWTGKGGTKEPYYRFWNNAIRWLIRDPELERVRISSFRTSYRLGEQTRFRIQVMDRQYRPLRKGQVKLSIRSAFEDDKNKKVQRTLKIPSSGTLVFSWKPPRSGMYRLEVVAELENGRKGKGKEIFQVTGLLDEFRSVQPHHTFFAYLKRKTSGQHLSFREQVSTLALNPPKVIRVDRSETRDLWDNMAFLSMLLLLFGAEWGFRRFWGLP
ncbi:MAG: glutamine amidotransferase [Myxococcota bacterium]